MHFLFLFILVICLFVAVHLYNFWLFFLGVLFIIALALHYAYDPNETADTRLP